MPRLSADEWGTIRAEREAGASFGELANRFDVSGPAIFKRAKKEGWGDGADVVDAVRKRVNEKVNGIVNGVDPQKKAAAIDAAADRVAEVLRRHQEEPGAVRAMLYGAIKSHKAAETKEQKALAFDDMKAAKISSEVLLNIHRLERQAFNLEVASSEDRTIVIERSYGRGK